MPGAFLVRTSTKKAGCFVITYKHGSGKIIHVLLERRADGWHGEGMLKAFWSLRDVLKRYEKSYSIPVSNGGKFNALREGK